MSVIVSKGNSPHNVSSGAPESSDSVVSGGSMFVLSGGTAFATSVSSGGFLTINKGGSGSGSILSGGSELVSGTEIGGLIQSGGSQRVFTSGKTIGTGILGNGVQDVFGAASGTTVGSRGPQNVDALGTAFGTTVNSGGLQSVHSAGKTSGTILSPFGQEDVGPFGLAISTTVNSGATLTISSGGTTSGATIGNGGQMLVSAGGVAADVTLNPGAVTSNAGIIKANSSATAVVGGVVTNANTIEALGSGALVQIFGSVTGSGSGTLLAVGSGARVELNGATISGGKLQTKSGGLIDVDFGVLSGATIVSGSIVDIGDADTLTLVGSAANSGVISMLGSANPATLTISGAMVLSGGGKVLLGPGGNNRIVAAAGGATLSNVNNTIAGAGNIGPGGNLTVVNAGKLEGTASGTLFLNTTVSNTSAGVILASGVAARVELNGATISGGKLQTLAGGEIDADFGSLTDTTIASGSVVKINDGATLILSGLINNLGVLSALGGANPAHLIVSGTVVLSGGGKVSLSSSGNNQIGSAGSGATLSNVNNTIVGAGVIGFSLGVVNGGKLEAATSNTLSLQTNISNTALGIILASGSGARVQLDGSATISGGTLQTLAGGEIDADFGALTDTTIASGSLVKINDGNSLVLAGHINNLGAISAAGSSNPTSLAISGAVVLSGGGSSAHVLLAAGATISGGKLQTKSGGEIDVSDGLLSNVTIASGSIVDIQNGGTLALAGRIVNSGLLSALGSANATTLAISGAAVLSGGGQVSLLSPSGNNRIVAVSSGAILSNVNNTIAGAGIIGLGGGLAVVNSGTINANSAATLQLFGLASAVNAGTFEATTSGLLILATDVHNNKTIAALGASADVSINSATISNGIVGVVFGLGQRGARRSQQRDHLRRQAADIGRGRGD